MLSEKDLKRMEAILSDEHRLQFADCDDLIADHRRMSAAIHKLPHSLFGICQFTRTPDMDCTAENCVYVAVQESSKEIA